MGHRIAFLLYPGFVGLDVSGPLEVFNTAAMVLFEKGHPESAYQFQYVALQQGPVKSFAGLAVLADIAPGDVQADSLIIPGASLTSGFDQNDKLQQLVKRLAAESKRVVSVCSGAFLLAACGLLDGKRATTHWSTAPELARRYPEIIVEPDAIFVRDGKIASSAGVTAGIDLALALVEEDYGIDVAMEVSRQLVVYRRRTGGQSQFSSPLQAQSRAGRKFLSLHRWIEDNLKEDLPVEHLAQQAMMSPRHFARVFQEETGITPGKYVELLRLDKARELLEAGEDHLQSIAELSGFGRVEKLRKVFLRKFGITPKQYQSHFS